ncbi:MAG TPA: hypothetical protein VG937_22600 [Polyangiaceae bacterium]|jgi:hypothetical protein|nr:hypothetical protein [Polyangiaceae bacterium]
MADSEKTTKELSDGLMEAWLKRHPRVDERRLRARLSQAMAALYGSADPQHPHELEEADLDDAAALAAALTEHVHFFRQFRSEAAVIEPDED